MKKKLQFLFSLVVLMLVASTAKAQIYLETDMTSKFSKLTEVGSWTGATGYTATNFCPMVEVGGGIGMKQVCEKYQETCENTGDVFYATVTGLAPGTYKIELYGGAAYTFGRGFPSTAFSEGTWEAGQKIEPSEEVSTGVLLYAESEDKTYGGEIPIYYATDFPEGAATVTLSGIVVGESGSIKIGLSKTSTSTNWHVIQLKSVTAQMKADDALAAAVASAQAIEEGSVPAVVYSEIQQVLADNNKSYETAAEYKTAIDAINAVVSKATAYPTVKGYLDKMEGVLSKTNFYTKDAYDTYYGNLKAAYEAGELKEAGEYTVDNAYSTNWRSANKIDDVLLSVWSIDDTQCKDYTAGLYINTWSTEGDSDGSNFKAPFFEYWTSDGNSLDAKNLTANLTEIPAGEYAIEASVRVRIKNGATGPTGITFSANGGEAVNVCDGAQVGTSQMYIKNVRVPVTVDEEGKLTAQFSVAADNNISWLSFQDVKYITAAEAAQKELDENYAAAQAAIQDGNYYEISTKVGETTYYLKMNDGKTGAILTADEAEATAFQFNAQKAAKDYLYETGWNLGVRFTNPSMDGGATGTPKNEGFIRCDGKNDRDTWERQVFFLNAEGEYAVRSTNSGGTTWGANTFWDVVDAAATPAIAGHGASISYVWNLTDVTEKATIAGAAEELAAAQAVVEAKQGVGDALFFIPEEAYNTYADAVAAAAAIINSTESTDEQILQAVADLRAATATYEATEVAKPVAGKAYVVANATAEGNLSVTTGKVSVETDAFVYFTEVEGGYAISNENGEYIFKTTGNTWTLSSTENLAEAYVLTVVPVAGGYTLKGANGLIGLDGTAAGSSCYANKAQSNNGLWTISEYVAPEIADLTADMFHAWTGVDGEATQTEEAVGCTYSLNTLTDMIYGTSTVSHTAYADLSDWDYLTIAAPVGTPRLQFNRQTADGQDHIKIPDNEGDVQNYVVKGEDGTFVYNLAAIKADKGYVHLNAIKTSGGAGIIQSMTLSTIKPIEPTWYTLSVAEGIENGEITLPFTKSIEGAPVKVTATPAEGYEFAGVVYAEEGEEEGEEDEDGTFNMPAANIVVAGVFTKAPEYVYEDLTQEMYHVWTGVDATAEIAEEDNPGCLFAFGESADNIYGNSNMPANQYADLSDYETLTLIATAGTPRVQFNRKTDSGQDHIKIPDNAADVEAYLKSQTTDAETGETTYVYDLAAIYDDWGYVHLNAIKGADWKPATIISAKLAKLEEVPEIVLNCAGFSLEEGTQAEPNIYPAGNELWVYFSADNLEENLVDEDATKVKVTVMVSGDLPENLMTMGSETAHRVMGETFYIPLGETAFPVELKPGYVYQNVAIMEAQLVLPDEEDPEADVVLATYAGEPIQLHWVGIAAEEEEEDPEFIEIAQEQSPEIEDGASRATVEDGEGYTQYTTDGGVCVIVKMYDVDVTGCDYVQINFAEPIPAGIRAAFWSQSGTDNVELDAGITEYKYVFADDPKCAIENGILPQITLLTLWNQQTVKVEGIYKHLIPSKQDIAIDRIVGQGYTAQTEEIDFSAAAAYLGVEEITYDMLRIVEADGTLNSSYAPYDGWFNADGAKTWNDISAAGEKGICIKLSQAVEGGKYEVCDMGNPVVGDKFKVQWAAVANDKTFYFNINVTFVEAPEVKPEIVKTIEIAGIDCAGAAYAQNPINEAGDKRPAITFDVAEVCEALGIQDISEASAFIVNVTTGDFVMNSTDGWRDANGDAAQWGAATNGYCLKLNNPASGEFDYAAAHDDNFQEGNTYVAQWGLVNADNKAVLLRTTITFVSESEWDAAVLETGINGVAGGKAKAEGRKYIEDGKVYIFRNGKKVLVSGIQTK